MSSFVRSWGSPSSPAPPQGPGPPPLGSARKALLKASSLLFCNTDTHLRKGCEGAWERYPQGWVTWLGGR